MKNLILLLSLLISMASYSQSKFSTSLHSTREGKHDAYKASNGGMELITGIPMDDLACKKCHSTDGFNANGEQIVDSTYVPSCKDCHNSDSFEVAEQTCLNCHNRQVYERAAYPNVDVHKASGMVCIDCHKEAEIHGDDGVKYVSLKQPGAIKVTCTQCHTTLSSNTSHDVHSATVECAACHAKAILTCASCHFETVVATGKNRAINQLKNYKLLVKKDGKIGLGGFMTHTYDGKTNYIISGYHSHAITKNATTCGDCHYNLGEKNAAIAEYNGTGNITMTKWNETTKKIAGPTGVVPLPSDWKTSLKFDFATYTGDKNNLTSDPNAWVYLKSSVDNSHLYFAEPLDNETLTKLGFARLPTGVNENLNGNKDFYIRGNFPNPFSQSTTIEFNLLNTGMISLEVYNIEGKKVRTILNRQNYAPGTYSVNWNGDTDRGSRA
ncbi:MAG: hypothetical protein LC658_11770, partial [Bacteroidales bacterium]|nr:hypothetical protein [Bacteroidales bacterium]